MGRSYPRLNIIEFGQHLLDTNDLDPIYVALTEVGWPDDKIQRWLVAYWCYYNAGVASYMCSFKGEEFWHRMMVAAKNEQPTPLGTRWARGSERRHFRGQQATKAVTELIEKYQDAPEAMAAYCTFWGTKENVEFTDVTNRIQGHRGFGPWIGFKVADMADRVAGTPVNFSEAAVFMFKDPVQAALRLWREHTKVPESAKPKNKQQEQRIIHQVLEYLENNLGDRLAPPSYERKLNLQEYETILCKWKSHMNGHYPLNNDIVEIREGLEDWISHSKEAAEFLSAMPNGGVS